MSMLLGLGLGDILYLSTKQSGGTDFDYAWRDCYYIFRPYVSPSMQRYFESEEWHDQIMYDDMLYRVANRSLDLTIDNVLGRERFEEELQKFKRALQVVEERCGENGPNKSSSSRRRRCSEGGELVAEVNSDCLWDSTGCGMDCLDRVSDELGLSAPSPRIDRRQ